MLLIFPYAAHTFRAFSLEHIYHYGIPKNTNCNSPYSIPKNTNYNSLYSISKNNDCNSPYSIPEKPQNAIAISAPVTNTIGEPFTFFSIGASSRCSLIEAMITIAMQKPTEVPIPFTTA